MTAGSCDAAISSMATSQQGQRVLEFIDLARKKKKPPDTLAYMEGLKACAAGDLWEKALELFCECLSIEKRQPSHTSYHLAMVLAGQGQKWEMALHFLNDLWAKGVPPGEVGYSSVVGVCEISGRWLEATELVREMRRKGFTVNKETLSSAWRACRLAGEESLASDLAEDMADLGLGEPISEAPAVQKSVLADSPTKSSDLKEALLR